MELKPHFLIPAWLEVQTGWAEIQWGVGDWGGGMQGQIGQLSCWGGGGRERPEPGRVSAIPICPPAATGLRVPNPSEGP